MTLKTIYIARHGYRSNWLPEPHPPNPTGIDSDPPLAPHGVDQAKQLAAYLHSLPSIEQPQFIISSPFYRCVETCQPIAQILSLSVVIERGVGEWYRKGRKVIPSPANYDTLHRFFKDVLVEESEWPRDETIGIIPSLSGETPEEIFDRASLFWKKFFPIFENKYPHIESILIVTHAATKIALGTSLLGLSTVYDSIDEHGTKPRAGACSLDKYIKSNSNQWENVMNGNCEFLLKGEEMHWDFSITVEAGSDEDIKLRKLKELELQKQNENKKQIKDTTPVTEIATGQENDDEFEVSKF
ncbi:histidine phosphatase superfamily [Scheffersomyces coipomensis]|uniref:histidine phosphatase superfamily n=1 Tax=Scheffersomyces coipomensis TaxID=1788519 RepID=UPI00315C75D4